MITNKPDHLFWVWLAGVIDGDGSLQLSRAGYSSLEITVSLADRCLLLYIQSRLGGYIEPRSGSNSLRYRLHNTGGILILIKGINGLIVHSGRLVQLKRLCEYFNVPFISPVPLNGPSAYHSGYFDADGHSSLGNWQNGNPQISIRISAKLLVNLFSFSLLGGSTWLDDSNSSGGGT